jgi:hypothetical protein
MILRVALSRDCGRYFSIAWRGVFCHIRRIPCYAFVPHSVPYSLDSKYNSFMTLTVVGDILIHMVPTIFLVVVLAVIKPRMALKSSTQT